MAIGFSNKFKSKLATGTVVFPYRLREGLGVGQDVGFMSNISTCGQLPAHPQPLPQAVGRREPHLWFSNCAFTLVEMSVVLVIIGLLILTVFPALTVSRQNAARTTTQNNLQALLRASAAYVQANGCVPCPTPANYPITIADVPGYGRVRGDVVNKACNGCAVPEGIPPYVSLGISPNVAHDGWGQWISMRVDPALTSSSLNIVPPTTPCTATDLNAPVTPTCTVVNASQKGICQTGLNTANRVSVRTTSNGANQPAAVIFISYGSKSYGAFKSAVQPILTANSNGSRLFFPTIPSSGNTQNLACNTPSSGLAYAMCNATGKNTFYDAPAQEGYDDMMVYADRNTLVSMLGNNATCQTVW